MSIAPLKGADRILLLRTNQSRCAALQPRPDRELQQLLARTVSPPGFASLQGFGETFYLLPVKDIAITR